MLLFRLLNGQRKIQNENRKETKDIYLRQKEKKQYIEVLLNLGRNFLKNIRLIVWFKPLLEMEHLKGCRVKYVDLIKLMPIMTIIINHWTFDGYVKFAMLGYIK